MERNNNDDEADDINRNLLANNNNNNNIDNNENIQIRMMIRNRNNNNQNPNNEEQAGEYLSKYSIFTLSFVIIFIINIIFWIYLKYKDSDEEYKYVFEKEAIVTHKQYYRFITRYFIHFGFGHLLIEILISWFMFYLFENIYGTLFTISFIIIAMIINSIVQLAFNLLIFYYIYILNIINYSNINYEGGFAPILFALNTFLCSFNNEYLNNNNFPFLVMNKADFSSFYILIIIAFITPNRSFIGNLSGILTAYFIKYICISFLPKISWLIELENCLGLNKYNGEFYRNITGENIIMKKILNKIENNCIEDEENEKSEENNINSNDNINNDNDNEEINNSSRNNVVNREAPRQEHIEMAFIQNSENNRNN